MKKIIFVFLLLLTITACKVPNNNHILEPGMVCTILDKQYPSLMDAINDASNNAVINLYKSITEEIIIENKNISIIGKVDDVVISKTNNLYNSFTSSRNVRTCGIIIIKGGTVLLENITIDGKGQIKNDEQTVGIGVVDGNITMKMVKVINIYESEPDIENNNNGIGILFQNTDDNPSDIKVIDCAIANFQKGGIYFYNSNIIDGFQLEIKNTTISGTGHESITPQTGVLLAGSANGLIENNTFSNLSYAPGTVKAQAILGIDIDITKLVIKDNNFQNVDQEYSFNS